MKLIPPSLVRLHQLKKKRRNKATTIVPITNKPEEQPENLQGLCSLGCTSCQRFNNIRCFMIFYCILLVAQGIVFGLVDLSIDMFQKGNRLRTIETVVVSSSYDISSCLVVVFISYYGGRGNVLRWIMFSSLLIGLGSLLFAYPYFSGENYQLNIDTEDICKEMKIVKTCKKSLSFQSKYVPFFILGQSVQGIAGMPLYTLGVIFLDDNLATQSTGIYLGFMEFSVTIGYALGYTIGAPLIKSLENNNSDNSVGVSDDNERWFQTWWIRFIFVSILAWSTLIPLSCFTKSLQGTARIKSGKHKKPHLLDRKYKDQEFETSSKDLSASIWILMKTPMFVCLALTKASESLLTIGASEFLPKYTENQFILTSSEATIVSGLILIPGGALGQLLGGAIVSKLHMSYKGLMRFIMVTSAISLVLVVFAVFVRCKPIPFAGINENYNGTGQLGNLTAPCNSYCSCSSSFYSPICGRNDIGYFSPCFAGCTYFKTFKRQKTYFNCSCIDEGLTTSDNQGDFIDARLGICQAKCYKLPVFIVFIFSTITFAAFSAVPITLTILRIVPDKQRSLALGITFVILRIFGSIPGPIVFKMAVESSCTYWDGGRCGHKRNCRLYNATKMSYLFLGICFFSKLFTIIVTAVAFSLSKYLVKENSDTFSVAMKNPKLKQKEKKRTVL
ncbi:PREDICTED: solute carrier organic anion transporter family member 6A1 [Miniopterus natalensis]|uniref:solute carrier organic anion transporter family member 6A1 n=1 Tax=Miniopterus natalensis TaxID=291302 RepID=UPI0007A7125C|nr:PREDICTED: solute carrier organic anion transporter family member 6A1 [Miniopterus natalensis]